MSRHRKGNNYNKDRYGGNYDNRKPEPQYDDRGQVVNWYELNPRVGVYHGDSNHQIHKEELVTGEDVLEIDGSILEGGGQILRISMSLSCILRRKIRIHKIRAGRTKPGLGAQHLTGIELLSLLCDGALVGGSKGSTDITFTPGLFNPSSEMFGITGTAGSICLLLQTTLPVILFAPSIKSGSDNLKASMKLMGGTDADFAPPIDYYNHIFMEYLQWICPESEQLIKLHLHRRGFFPKGGGAVSVDVARGVSPVRLSGFTVIDRGDVRSIRAVVYSAGDRALSPAKQCLATATNMLQQHYPKINIDTDIKVLGGKEYIGGGWGIQITAYTNTRCVLSQTGIGSPKIDPETLAEDVVKRLSSDIDCGACVDSHMQDQLIIAMFLATGESKIKTGPLTLHTKTAMHVCQIFDKDVKFTVSKVDSDVYCEPTMECFIIHCTGQSTS